MKDSRLERLRAYLVAECGGNKSELARRAGKKQSYISDLLAGRKSFGEKAARDLEAKLKKPPGWLDGKASTVQEPALPYNDRPTVPDLIARRLVDLDPTVQLAILNLLETIIAASREKPRHRRAEAA